MHDKRKGHKQSANPKGHSEARSGGGVQAAAITESAASSPATASAAEEVVAAVVPAAATEPEDDKERARLVELYGKALESFERTIVSVSSGALALSITFLHDLTPTPIPWSVRDLWWGWGGLLASLGVIVVSMPVGHWVLERAMEKKSTKWHSWVITAMNAASVVALLVGFIGLARFAQINMFAPKPVPACQPTSAAAATPTVPSAKSLPAKPAVSVP